MNELRRVCLSSHAIAAAVALVVMSCTSEPELVSAPTGVSLLAGGSAVDGGLAALPLLGIEDRWSLREAHVALVAKCMQEAGFAGYSFVPTPFPRDRLEATSDGVELLIASADQTSFGLVEASRHQPDGPPSDEYFNSLSPDAQNRYADALYGSGPLEAVEDDGAVITRPASGCLTMAEQQLYQADDYFTLDSQRSLLIAGIGPSVIAHPEFHRLLADYSTCMSAVGFAAASPTVARQIVANRLQTDGATQESAAFEQNVATADAGCQGEVAYGDRATRIHAEVVADAVEQSEDLARLVEVEREALDRARKLLQE